MRCPNCETEMDREDSAPRGWIESIYQCPECGLEAHWLKGGSLTITWDPRTGEYCLPRSGERKQRPRDADAKEIDNDNAVLE